MNEDAKKTAVRMIPYGMFVLTSKSKEGEDVGAATINWITQASFSPPLIAVGVKTDSTNHHHIKDTGVFAINVINKDQLDMAFNFFKTHQREGDSIGGERFEAGPETGCRCWRVLRRGGNATWSVRWPKETTPCLSVRWWRPASEARTKPSSCETTTSITAASRD